MSAQDEMDFNSGMMAFEAKHFSRAMQILSVIAEKGNTDAMHRCAIMYQNGLGVAVNKEAAAKWMKLAAEKGHELAQHGLGFMYMEGDCVEQNEQGSGGVEKDLNKAKEWYAKAGFSPEEFKS